MYIHGGIKVTGLQLCMLMYSVTWDVSTSSVPHYPGRNGYITAILSVYMVRVVVLLCMDFGCERSP